MAVPQKQTHVMVGISPEIHTKLKIQAATERRTIKAVLEKLIEDYLESVGTSKKLPAKR